MMKNKGDSQFAEEVLFISISDLSGANNQIMK